MRILLYIFYFLFVSWIPGGNHTLGKTVRRFFQILLGIKLGRNAVIGKGTFFSYSSAKKITLGDNSGIGSHSYIFGDGEVTIGDNVVSGPRITLVTRWHDFAYDDSGKRIMNSQKSGKIVIEDDVFLGVNVTILPNVRIGRGSIIAAGSVVYKSVSPMSKVFTARMSTNVIET